jgi:hypothetical protein
MPASTTLQMLQHTIRMMTQRLTLMTMRISTKPEIELVTTAWSVNVPEEGSRLTG